MLKICCGILLAGYSAVAAPVDLRCDYRVNPLAVEREHPALFWRVDTDQSAYQIQAAVSVEEWMKGTLWDSGWVKSSQTTHVPYRGKPVPPATRVYWRVRIKDKAGKVSEWSEPAWFETGLMNEEQWQGAQWISSTRKRTSQLAPRELMGTWISPLSEDVLKQNKPLIYRKSFKLPDKPVVYAGAWWGTARPAPVECTINGDGAKYTFRRDRMHYTDFAFCVHPGSNRLELKLPRPSGKAAISFGMQVVFADGEEQVVQSSPDWEANGNPVRKVCDYGKKPYGEAEVYALAPLPATWYKRDFTVDRPVDSARLYVCGLGYNEPYLNGSKVGDHVLDPGQTDYEEYALYQTFDVTKQIKQGDNALAVLLGDGWYNQDRGFCQPNLRYGDPGLRALLCIRFADGSVENVISDENWKWRESGTLLSNVYLGDHIDFRREHDEWQHPGFSNGWKKVRTVPPLAPRLRAQDFEPIRRIRTIRPVKRWQIGAKTWIFDLGVNISGWVRLKINEPEGTVVRVRCTEMLTEDGKYLQNVPKSFWWCHGQPQHHELICDGRLHTWEPHFSYHGFRYFEVSGLSHAPGADDVLGVVVHTDVKVTASFESSDPLLNRIFEMGVRTHLNNMHSILEDCPHREKCMWGGDLHSSWALGFHALDSTAFYRQQVNLYYTPPFSKSGVPGNVGVGRRISKSFNDFSWPVSPLFLTWRLYQVDDELDTVSRNYDRMRWFLEYFEKNAPGLIPKEAAHGDHAAPPDIERPEQNKNLIAAMNFFAAANRFAEMATALGRGRDAVWAKDLAGRIRTSIIEKYYDIKRHTFGNGTQDSLALAFGIAAPKERAAVAESLARRYRENGKVFDGGFMSYFIYPQLAENGDVDLALEMLRNPDYPGLAWSIVNFDATTIWERYNLDKEMREDRSHDHHAMNHPAAWLITHLAGIQAYYEKIILRPYIPKDLDWVKASEETLRGTIESSWRKEDSKLKWTVTVPPNCTAEAFFPEESGYPPKILSSGKYYFEWPL